MQGKVHKCGACFPPGAQVVEEAMAGDLEAFERFSRLSREGKSPALCQKPGGNYYVCHLEYRRPRNGS